MIKTPQSDQDDIHHTHMQHQLTQSALHKHFLLKIWALDCPLASLNNATLHSTLMAVTAPDGKNYSFPWTPVGMARDLMSPS